MPSSDRAPCESAAAVWCLGLIAYSSITADGSPIIVLINNPNNVATNVPIQLVGGIGASQISGYTTSATLNLAQGSVAPVNNGQFTYTIPPQSVTTLINNPLGPAPAPALVPMVSVPRFCKTASQTSITLSSTGPNT